MGNAKFDRSFEKHPEWDARRRAKALGCTVADVIAYQCTPMEESKVGKSLADFRKQYDKNFIVPEKIEKALRQLGAGGWETELNFAKLAGVSMTDVGLFREKYQDHVVLVERGSRRIWAGSKSLAKKLKEMV
jgi:hypothetical protein